MAMTDADLLAEFTDDEIETLKCSRQIGITRVRALTDQLERAQLDLDNVDFMIQGWLTKLRDELSHCCGKQPFCTLQAGHMGDCPAPVFTRIKPAAP